MLHLIVLRHAKSDWEAGATSDHERPLNARGRREAPIVGARLVEQGFAPEWISSSDSTRTRETLAAMKLHLGAVETRFDRRLYLADLEAVRQLAEELPVDVRRWMIVGHNPGWEELVTTVTARPTEMKTAYAAVLRGPAKSFVELLDGSRTLELHRLITPD
jgi:phosphohistidine phosphatase